MAIRPNDLDAGLAKITENIRDHCNQGSQSKGLKDALACGQFFGQDVSERAQRGLHGTAAALRILLGEPNPGHENVATAKALLKYTQDRSKYEEGQGAGTKDSIADDEQNTIKQAELLAALSPTVRADHYRDLLLGQIKGGMDQATGAWSFFLDENNPQDVPTAYAVIALNLRGMRDDFTKARNYLWSAQQSLAQSSDAQDVNAIARRSIDLYALAVSESKETAQEFSSKELQNSITSLWKQCRPFYSSPYEITVEYYRANKNHYVKIPWQIYLAQALLLVRPNELYSSRYQEFLSSLMLQAQSGGYRYEHGGPYRSTRTNASVYALLSYAATLDVTPTALFKAQDFLRELWVKPWFRTAVIFMLGFLLLYATDGAKQRLDAHSPLWPNVISSLLVTGLAWLYGRGRRAS